MVAANLDESLREASISVVLPHQPDGVLSAEALKASPTGEKINGAINRSRVLPVRVGVHRLLSAIYADATTDIRDHLPCAPWRILWGSSND